MPKNKIALALLLSIGGYATLLPVTRRAYGLPAVMINEFELNPLGDDSAPGAEFVELFNPGPTTVAIGGWLLATTQGVPILVMIHLGVVIHAKGFYVVTQTAQWLSDIDERIVLRNLAAVEVDATPVKSDTFNDARSWQRYPDGASNWVFDTSTRSTINVPEFPAPTFIMALTLLSAFILLRKRRFLADPQPMPRIS